jgi:hypothetical protein
VPSHRPIGAQRRAAKRANLEVGAGIAEGCVEVPAVPSSYNERTDSSSPATSPTPAARRLGGAWGGAVARVEVFDERDRRVARSLVAPLTVAEVDVLKARAVG